MQSVIFQASPWTMEILQPWLEVGDHWHLLLVLLSLFLIFSWLNCRSPELFKLCLKLFEHSSVRFSSISVAQSGSTHSFKPHQLHLYVELNHLVWCCDTFSLVSHLPGIIGGLLLVLICVLALLLWCLSRQKGSYVTNEMDDDDEDNNDGDDEEESVSSDTALQSKEPLKDKEEEWRYRNWTNKDLRWWGWGWRGIL